MRIWKIFKNCGKSEITNKKYEGSHEDAYLTYQYIFCEICL